MRRVLPVLAFLVWAAADECDSHGYGAGDTHTRAAPLDVTLTATGDAVAYRWELGDRTQAEGSIVQHA